MRWRAACSQRAPLEFERHQGAGLDLVAGAHELGLAQRAGDAHEFLADGRHQLGQVVFARAGIDAEQAAIAIGGVEAVDAVDQAALLADTLEQARGHAAAEQGRIDGEREIVGIAIADALAAQHQVGLLQHPRLAPVAADIAAAAPAARRWPACAAPSRNACWRDRRPGRARPGRPPTGPCWRRCSGGRDRRTDRRGRSPRRRPPCPAPDGRAAGRAARSPGTGRRSRRRACRAPGRSPAG